jgi:hypothetical protein
LAAGNVVYSIAAFVKAGEAKKNCTEMSPSVAREGDQIVQGLWLSPMCQFDYTRADEVYLTLHSRPLRR